MKWVHLRITLPDDDEARGLFAFLDGMGFKQLDEDWCTLKREDDNATVDFSPSEEPPDRKVGW